MKRRIFLSVSATFLPWNVRARTARLPLVGSVNAGTYGPNAPYVTAFQQGMADRGYVEGKSVTYEHLWADEQYDRLPAMAAQLVSHNADLIVTTNVASAARAAMEATRAIPIVFACNSDPVEAGLVASLARPGGNVTGLSYLVAELYPKWIQLLSELEPKPTKVGILTNPNAPLSRRMLDELNGAARAKQVELVLFKATNEQEIGEALVLAAGPPAVPMLFQNDQLVTRYRSQIVELVKRYRVPAMIAPREGGLMSYAPDILAVYREFGVLAGKVLAGTKPADLPVLQPTKFILLLNMTAAKTLGVGFPLSMQAAATEIIE